MEKEKLILVGGGGHCKSVIDVAESAGYTILGILDRPQEVGKRVLGYEVLGSDEDIPRYVGQAAFCITVGFISDPALRLRLFRRVKEAGGRLATIVSPTAHVSRHATLGEGTVVMHQAVVNAGACVGENVILNTCSNIEHDAVVGHQCHISTGAMVNGGCRIGHNVFVGSQAVVAQGLVVGDNLVIGAGAVVCRPILEQGVYAGNPAVLKRKLTWCSTY